MNDDSDSPSPCREGLADDRRRGAWPRGWSEVTRDGPRTITRVYSYVEPTPDCLWVIEHDPENGVFRLIDPDGRTSIFRDRPVRYLVAQADARTGELTPVIIQGSESRPRDLYLCAEEHERR